MKVLGLEASTDFASVALWVEERCVFEEKFASKRSLSSELFPLLWKLLEPVGEVERIVVGLGPGSYAGVRITIAAALGLQAVWGCELVGIPSVAALPVEEGCFQVIGDARRGTWYYTQVDEGACVEGPLLVDSGEALRECLRGKGGKVYATEQVPSEWEASVLVPSASLLAKRASAGIGILQYGDLEPLYLREVHITQPASQRD